MFKCEESPWVSLSGQTLLAPRHRVETCMARPHNRAVSPFRPNHQRFASAVGPPHQVRDVVPRARKQLWGKVYIVVVVSNNKGESVGRERGNLSRAQCARSCPIERFI